MNAQSIVLINDKDSESSAKVIEKHKNTVSALP